MKVKELSFDGNFTVHYRLSDGSEAKFSVPTELGLLIADAWAIRSKLTESSEVTVDAIITARDMLPYIRIANSFGVLAQMTIGQARKFANEMMIMSSRTEMDAMLVRFCTDEMESPESVIPMLKTFRDYRAKIDQEPSAVYFETPVEP